ncbi:MAG: ribosome recycling factor [Deltaproteobacteria bacterium]|nr:ribosome recycling factor [Deltaproteobacteria bacterium]
MLEEITRDLNKKMDQTIKVIAEEMAAVRTGRASADILKPITVEYYGAQTPLLQLATLATPDSQLITVTPFDPSASKAIEKAINSSQMGLNASMDGGIIRVPIPVLTEERRKEMVKHVRKLGEDGKIALRNLRRDANEHVKKLEKDKQISKDQEHDVESEIQKATDAHVSRIDELVRKKEQDLMTV